MKRIHLRFLLTLGFIFICSMSFAQLNGQFNYGQDGHVYFYLTNNTRYNIPVTVFAHNARNNQSRSENVTIMAGNVFFFGLNYNWAWEQGETMTITYANGQSYTWMCPVSDMANQQNSGYNNQNNYSNNQNYRKSNNNYKLSNIPAMGTVYYFGNSMSIYEVRVFLDGGRKKLSICHKSEKPLCIGTFFLDNGGYLTPDQNQIISGMNQLNNSKIDFGPNMSYIIIDGKRENKASDAERRQNQQLFIYGNQAREEILSEYRNSLRSSNSSSNSTQKRSTSSDNKTCTKCGGRKFEVQDYKYAPTSTSGWNQPYHNNAGTSCYICGKVTDHYHTPCSSCKGFGHN